jgi:hypothetical protein
VGAHAQLLALGLTLLAMIYNYGVNAALQPAPNIAVPPAVPVHANLQMPGGCSCLCPPPPLE